MNKKTCTVAVIFLLATLAWLGVNIYWDITKCMNYVDTILAIVFVLFAASMVHNELNKKKRKHLDEINKNKIP